VSKHSVFSWKIFRESISVDSTKETALKRYALRTYSNLYDKKIFTFGETHERTDMTGF
jgi:hypothetical protein